MMIIRTYTTPGLALSRAVTAGKPARQAQREYGKPGSRGIIIAAGASSDELSNSQVTIDGDAIMRALATAFCGFILTHTLGAWIGEWIVGPRAHWKADTNAQYY